MLPAGAKTVAVLAALLGAAAWARRDKLRQQRRPTAARPETLLGRLGSAVSARLQAGVLPLLQKVPFR